MKLQYIILTLGLLFGFASCEMRNELKGNIDNLQVNEGIMQLSLSTNSDEPVVHVRSIFPAEDTDINNYTIKIVVSETEETVKECTYSSLLEDGGEVKLIAGKYKVIAYNYDGRDVSASERPFFLGQTEFQILPGKITDVTTTCRLQDIGVSLSLSEDFISEFKDDYTITVSNKSNGNYIFTKENINKKIYFSIPQNANSISVSIKATTKKEVEITESYNISKPANAENNQELQPGDFFKINIDPGSEPSVDPVPVNKLKLNITVDLTMIETGVTIEIPTENIVEVPEEKEDNIQTEGLNKTYNLSIDPNDQVPPIRVSLTVPNGIQKLLVRINSNNAAFMETLAGFNLVQEFDLANPGDLLGVLSGSLEDLEGIGLINANDPIKGKTSYVFDVTKFMTLLKLYGLSNNTFTITVADGANETVTGALNINIVDTSK